jgi:signal transduction histidine kinase
MERRRTVLSKHKFRLNGETLVGFFCVTGGVYTATAVFYFSRGRLDPWQISLLYLPVVIACAVRFGFATAIWGAVLSFICWDYFLLRPLHTLSLSDPRDAIALSVFLIAAATTSFLASRAQQQAHEAEARAGEAKMLYMVSQVIGREIDAGQLLSTLAGEVARLCDAPVCAILRCKALPDGVAIVTLASDTQASRSRDLLIEQNAQKVLKEQTETLDYEQLTAGDSITRPIIAPVRIKGDAGGLYLPLLVDGNTLGLIYVAYREDGMDFSFQDERLILTLASQAAVVMARDRLTDEATKQAQQVAILGERNRLAKEVHDTLSHAFTGIRFLLEAASVSGQTELPDIISQAREMAINGAQEARRSVWALRPVALDEGAGIVKAIRAVMKQQTFRTSITGTLNVIGDQRILSTDEEDNLLRICQEALTNVLRHSQATRITISITFESVKVLLSIADNGCGYSEDTVKYGYGVNNMRERAAAIGGSLLVKSISGSGTEIVVTVPAAK